MGCVHAILLNVSARVASPNIILIPSVVSLLAILFQLLRINMYGALKLEVVPIL